MIKLIRKTSHKTKSKLTKTKNSIIHKQQNLRQYNNYIKKRELNGEAYRNDELKEREKIKVRIMNGYGKSEERKRRDEP